jgi:hypothetical protein
VPVVFQLTRTGVGVEKVDDGNGIFGVITAASEFFL